MGTIECSQPASKSSWDSQDFGDISMVLKMAHFRKSTGPRWVKCVLIIQKEKCLIRVPTNPHAFNLCNEWAYMENGYRRGTFCASLNFTSNDQKKIIVCQDSFMTISLFVVFAFAMKLSQLFDETDNVIEMEPRKIRDTNTKSITKWHRKNEQFTEQKHIIHKTCHYSAPCSSIF